MEEPTTEQSKKFKSKHVLVVDDNEVFRNVLAQGLTKQGFQITQASNGKLAKDIIDAQEFYAIISDINMPEMNGLELLQYCQKTKPELPVILMTGFSQLKETKEAYALGARGFLPKPFKTEEILKALNECHIPKEKKADEEEKLDLKYCKISIEDFISGKEMKFDIYVRLSEKKYLKIAHEGEDIPIDRINAYKARGIDYLYMLKDDFKKYLGFNSALLPMVKANSNISRDKKLVFLKHTSDVVQEYIYVNGIDRVAFEGAKAITESTASLLTEPDDVMNLLTLLNSHGDHLYAHGLGVSVYGVMIAKEVGWHTPANLFKVAMGGLLHDIGQKEIDREILLKQPKDMSFEELKLYQAHPQRGMEILKQIPSIPTDILQIILQHHEACSGVGFPRHLIKNKIHPMARLIAVADEFCKIVLKGPNCLNLTPVDALQRMHSLDNGTFDHTFLFALMRIFKMQPPKKNSK